MESEKYPLKALKVLMVSILLFIGLGIGIPVGWAVVSSLLTAFTLGLNTHPPAYIRDVVAYKEGDGLVIYLTMADSSGALTRADGLLSVSIRQEWDPVWSFSRSVSREHFQTAKVGLGALERTTLLYSLGRISDRQLAAARPGKALTIDVSFMVDLQ